MKFSRNINIIAVVCYLIIVSSCKKLVEVPLPVDTITSDVAFSTDATATAALVYVYQNMSQGTSRFTLFNGGASIFGGLSADELNYAWGDAGFLSYKTNSIQPADSYISDFWMNVYNSIYAINAVIDGVEGSAGVSAATKKQLIGEAKFLRAFHNFYLINLYGDVPLVNTINWTKINLLSRTSVEKIYEQVIIDLQDAQQLLPDDFAVSNQERVRANKWAATALLARVQLYLKHYDAALEQSALLINNNPLFSLPANLKDVFLKNSKEAILQVAVSNQRYPYVLREGNEINPANTVEGPQFYLTDELLAAFEPGDKRRTDWVNSMTPPGDHIYYYPYKYTEYSGTANADVKQYGMVLRLAEQYLIHAEASAQKNDLQTAIDDLNMIRNRAGLTPELPAGLTQPEVFAYVTQERRIEFFSEFGHRWLDLKRTGTATTVLSPLKPTWKASAVLFPIPKNEISRDPNLTQNDGYPN